MMQLDNTAPTLSEYDKIDFIPLQSPAKGDQDFALPFNEKHIDLPDTLAECAL